MAPLDAMTCGVFVASLAERLDGTATRRARAAGSAHLLRCGACRRYAAGYAATLALARDAYAEPPPPLPEDVVQALLRAR
jgi:predicted anti-sigma-YlaC factor YlaD